MQFNLLSGENLLQRTADLTDLLFASRSGSSQASPVNAMGTRVGCLLYDVASLLGVLTVLAETSS
jgi:hypothetical protein